MKEKGKKDILANLPFSITEVSDSINSLIDINNVQSIEKDKIKDILDKALQSVKHWKNWTLFTTQKIRYC